MISSMRPMPWREDGRVVEELIPETVRSGSTDAATLGFIVGFAIMMALDNALG